MSVFSLLASAQNTAPFAGGVKLQQGGATSPALGLTMKSSNATAYTTNPILSWLEPSAGGILKVTNWNATNKTGDVAIGSISLTDDISGILAIANGGTGASTADGALTNLLPTQTGNDGKFLQTDGSVTSWQTAVTSVGLSLPGIFTVSNSPVTTTGTLTATLASQTANTVFAAPNGSDGAPTFRALAAADIPNLDASKITTGVLPIAQGGTNSSTALNNGRIMISAGDAIVEAAALTDGQLLIGSSAGAPVAATLTAGTGISIVNGANSITISANSANICTSHRIALSDAAVSYTTQSPAPGFTLTATSVINITVLEAGGYPISASVTSIDVVGNTFNFVLSGYPTDGSVALITLQN